jgi:hypothetical protein
VDCCVGVYSTFRTIPTVESYGAGVFCSRQGFQWVSFYIFFDSWFILDENNWLVFVFFANPPVRGKSMYFGVGELTYCRNSRKFSLESIVCTSYWKLYRT